MFNQLFDNDRTYCSQRQQMLTSTDYRTTSKIQNGDIIAITTSVPGLDISHTGIAVKEKDGMVYLLHAPDAGQKVQLTKEPLAKSLQAHPKQMGIVVLRAVEP